MLLLLSATVSGTAQTHNYTHPTMGWKISMPDNWLFGHNLNYYPAIYCIHKDYEKIVPRKIDPDAPQPPPDKYSTQFEPLDNEDISTCEMVFFVRDTNDVNRLMIRVCDVADIYKNDTSALYNFISQDAKNLLVYDGLKSEVNVNRQLINGKYYLVTNTVIRYKKKVIGNMDNYFWTDGNILFDAYLSHNNTSDHKVMHESLQKVLNSF